MKSLEDVLADSLCVGPMNEMVSRARKNVENYVGFHMLKRQKIILLLLAGLCATQIGSIILFFTLIKGR